MSVSLSDCPIIKLVFSTEFDHSDQYLNMIVMSSFSFWLNLTLALAMTYPIINGCPPDERGYLQDFRGALIDPAGRLSSWKGYNCCEWKGILCDFCSGHVISFDLKHGLPKKYGPNTYSLSGAIHPSLFNLQNLQHLDLGYIDFNGTPIPPQLAKVQSLAFLSLASSGFGGEVPLDLGNITTLRHVDLSSNNLDSRTFAQWIRNLRRLEYLDMEGIKLSAESKDCGNALSSLFSLREIRLSNCGLSGRIPSLLNLTHLSHLHLSQNSFNSPLPAWFQNVSSLLSIDLSYSYCDPNGSIPSNFLYRSNLRNLDLSFNYLDGVIPQSLANFTNLEILYLEKNYLIGDVPPFGSALGGAFPLSFIELSENELTGNIPLSIGRFPELRSLILNNNQLSGNIPPSIGRLSLLKILKLDNNQLSGSIPPSIGRLSLLKILKLDNN